MKAIDFPGTHRVYSAPDMDDLPAKDNARGILTVWQLSDAERVVIAAGGCVLVELGTQIPPSLRVGVIGAAKIFPPAASGEAG
jgi:hypothetical protein